MQRKILPFLYVDIVMPLLCCILLPSIAAKAKLKFIDNLIYKDIQKASIFNSIIFGIATYILCFIFIKLLNTLYLNIIVSFAIIFFLSWQFMPLVADFYRFSFNYVNALLGIYLSAMMVNSYYLLKNNKRVS